VSVTAAGTFGVSCSEYANNMNKTWNITISGNTKLALDYTVKTESGNDKILIYSINDAGTAVLQSTLSGTQNGQIVSLYGNGKMRVVFTSNASVNCSSNASYTGFSITASKVSGISFVYDAAGNRTNRTIVLESNSLRSSRVEEEIEGEEVQAEEPAWVEENVSYPIAESLQEAEIRIYPNPTEGRFAVEIGNLSNSVQGKMYLLDTNGRLLEKKDVRSEGKIDFDLSQKTTGIYLLNIQLGETVSTWKIIKK